MSGKVETKEIDHEYTDEVVCPYCGYIMSDSWELGDRDGGECEWEEICPECDKKFISARMITIDYKTRKMEDK